MSFLFFAIGVSIIIGALSKATRGRRDFSPMPQQTLLQDPRVPQMQAEIDELRAQVERLTAAESFYAQLNAPKPDVPSPTG
jgi:hypothetical protein